MKYNPIYRLRVALLSHKKLYLYNLLLRNIRFNQRSHAMSEIQMALCFETIHTHIAGARFGNQCFTLTFGCNNGVLFYFPNVVIDKKLGNNVPVGSNKMKR